MIKEPKITRKKSWIHRLILFFIMLISQVSFAIDIPNATLVYKIDYHGIRAGELEVIIQREGNQYKVSSISHLNTLAKLFLAEQISLAWFDIDGDHLKLSHGRDLTRNRATIKRSFHINQNKKNINFSEREAIPFSSTSIFDSTSFPLVLVANPNASYPNNVVFEVSTKRLRKYLQQTPINQTVKINGISYMTRLVRRSAEHDATRRVDYYLDQSRFNFPLKIQSLKKGKPTTLTFTHIKF